MQMGYSLAPRGNSDLLKKVGLLRGDVITAVNGISLSDPASMAAMASELSSADSAMLSITRNNTPMTVKIGR